MAPEVWNSSGHYTIKADVYSYAIIIWETFSKKIPFEELQFDHLIAGTHH
jgi:serine/threonine protein kinase